MCVCCCLRLYGYVVFGQKQHGVPPSRSETLQPDGSSGACSEHLESEGEEVGLTSLLQKAVNTVIFYSSERAVGTILGYPLRNYSGAR